MLTHAIFTKCSVVVDFLAKMASLLPFSQGYHSNPIIQPKQIIIAMYYIKATVGRLVSEEAVYSQRGLLLATRQFGSC